MNSRSKLGVPLGRRYEGCWKALCLFTEAREQILCTFPGRSMPGWLHLPQMPQSYLTIHSYCLHKRSLNLLCASPFAAPSFPPPKQPQYLLSLNLFNTKLSVWGYPSKIPVGLLVLSHSIFTGENDSSYTSWHHTLVSQPCIPLAKGCQIVLS